MIKLTARTNQGKIDITGPEKMEEVTVDLYQQVIRKWDREDWVQLFSILFNTNADGIAQSKDYRVESTLYNTIEFFLMGERKLEECEVPSFLMINNRQVAIPKKIGKLSIGQTIQARKSLEGITDLREGISIVTAIYLQPLIDKGKYDHVRAIEIEQDILRMPITHIFPIGFFLLARLNGSGSKLINALNLIKRLIMPRGGR